MTIRLSMMKLWDTSKSWQDMARHPITVALVSCAVGVGGTLAFTSGTSSGTAPKIVEDHLLKSSTALTNPLLSCDTFASVPTSQTDDIEHAIKTVAQGAKARGDARDISVYYRDLNNGPWVGYNEQEAFIPASLLKLPLLLAYMKADETNPKIFEQRVVHSSVLDSTPQTIKTGEEIVAGQTYTVQQLLYSMIVNSDNNAALLLYGGLNRSASSQVYVDLGLRSPSEGSDFTMTARNYATFFRVLYNASYLSRASSELALSLLMQVTYHGGIVAGVPAGVRVAHKFGEREDGRIDKELHDCGIVYHPKYPYVLCVMTKGSDLSKLAPVIAEISKSVFDTVSSDTN